jgi:hypothetical protein
MFMP